MSSTTTWVACAGYFSETPSDQAVWIGLRNGLISDLRQEAPEGVEDMPSLYAAPLLADTHAHVYMNPWPLDPTKREKPGSGKFESEVADAVLRLEQALKAGVGFVRDMGDPFGINLAVKSRIQEDQTAAPVLHLPGPAIHRPKKYGRYLGVSRESMDDILELIGELSEDTRVNFIKLTTTGIVSFKDKCVKQVPQFTLEELRTAVDHAHRLGYKTAAHCSGEEGLDIALEAGVDFIEHGYFVNEDQRQRMADHQHCWTPTFAPVLSQYVNRDVCGWDDEIADNLEDILDQHGGSVVDGVKKGVTILTGTDGGSPGVPLGIALKDELGSLQKAGLNPADILRLATSTAADACAPEGYTGRLRVGDPADFALYEQAPWENVANLASLHTVYKRGWAC